MTPEHSIPVADLVDGPTPEFDQAFGDGLRDFGFVSVVNHGIPFEQIVRAYEIAKQVFDLPLVTKQQYETPENGRQTGYTSPRIETAQGQTVPDEKEFWHIYRPGHTIANIFPEEVPEFEQVALLLYHAFDQLSMILLGSIGVYLGRPRTFFQDWAEGGNNLMRVLNYPPLVGSEQGVRSAEHTDINLITLLPAATLAGLRIRGHSGQMMSVTNPPESIIVNVGDMLALHCACHPDRTDLPSTPHEVANLPGRRLSIPYFVHPRSDVPLVTAEDFLVRRLKEIGLIK